MDDWKTKLALLRGDVPKGPLKPNDSDQGVVKPAGPSAPSSGLKTQPQIGPAKSATLRPGMNYEDLISANETLTAENQNLRAALEETQKALQVASSTAAAAVASRDLASSELRKLQEKLLAIPQGQDLDAALLDLQDLEALRKSLLHLQEELRTRESALSRDENSLAQLRDLDRREQALQREDVRVRTETNKLTSAQAALRQKAEKLKKREADVKGYEDDLRHFRSVERQLRKTESMFIDSEKDKDRLKRLLDAQKARFQEMNQRLSVAKNLAKESQKTAEALQDRLDEAPLGELGIRSIDTARWLTQNFCGPRSVSLPTKVLVIGEGPFDLDEIYDLLTERKFSVDYEWTNASCEIVVVGRDNWNSEQIQEQIALRDGKPLRIYTQELFIIYLMLGTDPLEMASAEDLLKFADDHALMQYLLEQQFPWPDSQFFHDGPLHLGEGFDSEDASSPMFRLGYSVAQNKGLSSSQRRQLLDKTLGCEELPWCISDDYMSEWGTRASAARLRRMAWHIHLMTKRHRQHSQAVEKWTLDLEWLRETKYKPIHRFRWPL